MNSICVNRYTFVFLIMLATSFSLRASEIILVGGKGNAENLDRLKERLASKSPSQTTVIFTGNYSKYHGMPGKNHKDRLKVERKIDVYIDAVSNFIQKGGTVFFLPGRKDFKGKRKRISNLGDYINESLGKVSVGHHQKDFMPLQSCGDIQIVSLDSEHSLFLINSQWWMLDHEQFGSTNKGCHIKSRGQFIKEIEWAFRKNRTKKIIIAMSHPIESLGKYGGSYKFLDLLIPPFLGGIKVFLKNNGFYDQYTPHARYRSLVDSILTFARSYGKVLFLSGHDYGQQLLVKNGQTQIISSALSEAKNSFSNELEDEFTSKDVGWAEIDLKKKNAIFLKAKNFNVLKKASIHFGGQNAEKPLSNNGGKDLKNSKTEWTKRVPKKFGWMKRFLLGDHYRELYRLQNEFPVLNLAEKKLTPIKIGGGSQTNSLRLKDQNGGQWVIRSTTKVSSRILPYPFNNFTLAKFILEDGFTASHPYGANTVSFLSDAIGIYHTKPKAYFLPAQKEIEDFQDVISDEVVVMERRPESPDIGELPNHLGGKTGLKTKYQSTPKLIEKIKKSPWKHKVDQRNFLKARLLDLIVGDWDRHEDQWRFVGHKKENSYIYRPIPRDRDQAFSNVDGMLAFFGKLAIPPIRRFGKYSKNFGDLDWLTYSARHLDAFFLNQITIEEWLQVAREVQQSLSDKIIEDSVDLWPKNFKELHGDKIIGDLKERRDQLSKVAYEYYLKIYENVDIIGSKKADQVEINYTSHKHIEVILSRKRNNLIETYYRYTFDSDITNELRIYTLGKDDQFIIRGKPHDKIKLRLVSGSGRDLIQSDGELNLIADSIYVYDRPQGISINDNISVKDRRSESHYENQFDYFDVHHNPSSLSLIPVLKSNPDEGLFIGANLEGKLNGFKKNPYKIKHNLNLALQTSTFGAIAEYSAEVPYFHSRWDQLFGLNGNTPASGENFFGFTNNVIDVSGGDERDFYRIRSSEIGGHYGWQKKYFNNDLKIGALVRLRNIDVENTIGRSVNEILGSQIREFQRQTFAGGELFIKTSTVDNPNNPKQGIKSHLTVTALSNIDSNRDERFGGITLVDSSFAFYLPLDRLKRYVFSSKFNYSIQLSDDFPFYFAPTIGSGEIRSLNDEQLRGNAAFSQTTDLRIQTLKFEEHIPSTLDLVFSIDHGRVYGNRVPTDSHSFSAGVGILWNILGTAGLNISYHQGRSDTKRVALSFGNAF